MKTLAIFVFALLTAFSASAASLSFVKVGGTYTLHYVGSTMIVTVFEEQGDGWYRCRVSEGDASSYVNFNQATQVVALDEPVSGAKSNWLINPRTTPDAIRRAVLNNLRQLSAAADQYYLEKGASEVTLSELIGPTKYIRELVPVDGEDYARVVLKIGTPLKVVTRTGMVVSYGP